MWDSPEEARRAREGRDFLPAHPLSAHPAAATLGRAGEEVEAGGSAALPSPRAVYNPSIVRRCPCLSSATMPRKKAAAAWEEPSSGNGTARAGPRKRGGPAGRKRERPERCSSSSGGGSSGDEDGLELDGAPGGGKRAARPAATKAGGAAVVITEPEHTKERVVSAGSEGRGVRPAARHARSGRGGGAGAGHGLNHRRRRRRTTKGRGVGAGQRQARPVASSPQRRPPVRAAVDPWGARPGPPAGEGRLRPAPARPPARGGHGPAPGAARADRLRLPSPSRPGKGDFCKLSGTGVGDARAGPDARCPRPPPASCGRRSARARGRRGLLRAAGSGGLRLGFEVPAASAPALRGGGAWWPPRMPLAALPGLSRRRGAGGGRRWGGCEGACSGESSPPEVGSPRAERYLGFVPRLGSGGGALGEGSVPRSAPPLCRKHLRVLSGLGLAR